MRTILLAAASPILSIALLFGVSVRRQERPVQTDVSAAIGPDEYAVYSEFIDQKYIHPATRGGFSLKGTVINSFGPDKIKQVVILPNTLFTLEHFLSQKKLKEMLPSEAQAAFNDCVKHNEQSYPLAGNFKVSVAYSFFSEQDGNAASSVVNDSKAPLDRFVASHPTALGYLALSRVGFDTAHKVAVVGFAQTDFDVRSRSTRMWGGLVLLSKESGSWLVLKVFTEPAEAEPVTIDLSQCSPVNQSLAWGLGSATISVKGRRGPNCVIEHVSEIEGGFTQSECSIPNSLGPLTIHQGGMDFYYSFDVSKYCKVIKSGNSLLENLKP